MPEEEVDGPRPVIVAYTGTPSSLSRLWPLSFLFFHLRPKITHGVELKIYMYRVYLRRWRRKLNQLFSLPPYLFTFPPFHLPLTVHPRFDQTVVQGPFCAECTDAVWAGHDWMRPFDWLGCVEKRGLHTFPMVGGGEGRRDASVPETRTGSITLIPSPRE